MILSNAQKLALKQFILSDSALLDLLTNSPNGAEAVAGALNAPSNPAVVVFKTSVSQDEIMQNGFDWTRVDNLNVGKARVWEWMFANPQRSINPSKANVRAGIDQTWAGTAADLAVRAAVYIHCKRVATRFEALFAVGSGTEASPSTMALNGNIESRDVESALAQV